LSGLLVGDIIQYQRQRIANFWWQALHGGDQPIGQSGRFVVFSLPGQFPIAPVKRSLALP
jgi:hypothetical protein